MSQQPTSHARRSLGVAFVVAIIAALVGVPVTAASAHPLDPGHVSGTVLIAGTSTPIAGITVELIFSDGFAVAGATTNESGFFDLDASDAKPDTYTLRYSDPLTGLYADTYFGDVPYLQDATLFAFDPSSSYLGRDADMVRGAVLWGTVTGEDTGLGLGGVTIMLIDTNGDDYRSITTESDGSYWLDRVAEGSYAMHIQACAESTCERGYVSEYWWDKYTSATANLFWVWSDTSSNFNIDLSRVTLSRLGGADRFETSALITQNFPAASGPVVYIANGLDFPDALSAGPAAAIEDGVLLLTLPNSIPSVIRDELVRLEPSRIMVVGGAGVVSEAVVDELAAYGPVERQGGADRYETSRIVVSHASPFASVPSADVVAYLATGRGYADALAAAAAAGAHDTPVLLIDGLGAYPHAADSLLQDREVNALKLAGGPGVISSSLEASFQARPHVESVERFGGADRYETSLLINRDAFPGLRYPGTVYLATGAGFADALAGAAWAGLTGSPLYLVQPTCIPEEVMNDIATLGAVNVVLLGGTGVLSPAVEDLTTC